jgi:hypothetical protein
MVEFCNKIPTDLLRPKRATKSKKTGKYILMRMAEEKKLLPSEIIFQRKASPVTSPVDYWYMDQLKPFILSLFKDLPFPYDQAYAENLLRFKLAEELYRSITLGKYAGHAVSLLATYASFGKYCSIRNTNNAN